MVAARLEGANSVVANPAAGRFMGSKRELRVRRILPPARGEGEACALTLAMRASESAVEEPSQFVATCSFLVCHNFDGPL